MSRFMSGLLAFVTAAVVLVVEIVAARLMAPYVGVTLQTYTSIISVVLAGISFGAWLGGKIADRKDARGVLGPIVIVGGALVMLSLAIVRGFGSELDGGGAAPALILSSISFFAPAMVLSTVPPILVKLTLSDLDSAGSDVGRISALGTAGAIFGSMITGFLLVSTMSSTVILIAAGVFLVVLGLILSIWSARHRTGTVAAALVVVLISGSFAIATRTVCDLETAYACAKVLNDPKNDSGRYLRLDDVVNSYVDLDDPTYIEFEYTRGFAALVDVVAAKDRGLDVLHIGGGGFTLPQYVRKAYPGSTNLVVERDEELVKFDERELGLTTGDGLDVVADDARIAVRKLSGQSWDLVLGDAFNGYSVPWHLATIEFVKDVKETMRPQGIFAVNVIDGPRQEFVKAFVATMGAAFSNVTIAANRRSFEGERANFVVVASDYELPLKTIEQKFVDRELQFELLVGQNLMTWISNAKVLTDDFAPVDRLIDQSS